MPLALNALKNACDIKNCYSEHTATLYKGSVGCCIDGPAYVSLLFLARSEKTPSLGTHPEPIPPAPSSGRVHFQFSSEQTTLWLLAALLNEDVWQCTVGNYHHAQIVHLQ